MRSIHALCAVLALSAACGKKVDDKQREAPATADPKQGAPAKTYVGVDPQKKVIRLGALNDESGPAKQIGVAFANGKRLLVKAVNGGTIKALPEGWTIELIEKDHGYNPQQSVQLYKEIKDDILFLTTSFGTATTMPLLEDLARDDVLAFPASLSSQMAKQEHTPPLGASYAVEAMRAMDWAVEQAGGADKVKAGIIHQRDDYGMDGLAGWRQAAAHHKVTIVSEQTVKPTDQDFTAVVKALKDAGATHVLLSVLPSHTPGVLGTAMKMKYEPTWIGNTPAWVDVFFTKLPAPLLTHFHWVTGLPYWGEEHPGMKDFLTAWEKHGQGMGDPDFYILGSYIQGLVQLEVIRRAIAADDLSRAGVHTALRTLQGWDTGMGQSVDLSKLPYQTSTQTRILKPSIEKKGWESVAPYAEAAALAK
jgi:ABC-type branched-subunit amino acid transport system substrate-binding protein